VPEELVQLAASAPPQKIAADDVVDPELWKLTDAVDVSTASDFTSTM
jgi:hypothetical protein